MRKLKLKKWNHLPGTKWQRHFYLGFLTPHPLDLISIFVCLFVTCLNNNDFFLPTGEKEGIKGEELLPRWLSGEESACQRRRHLSDPSIGRSPGEGNGNPLHSSILAWATLWKERPGGLQSTALQRVRQDWAHHGTAKLRGRTSQFRQKGERPGGRSS